MVTQYHNFAYNLDSPEIPLKAKNALCKQQSPMLQYLYISYYLFAYLRGSPYDGWYQKTRENPYYRMDTYI